MGRSQGGSTCLHCWIWLRPHLVHCVSRAKDYWEWRAPEIEWEASQWLSWVWICSWAEQCFDVSVQWTQWFGRLANCTVKERLIYRSTVGILSMHVWYSIFVMCKVESSRLREVPSGSAVRQWNGACPLCIVRCLGPGTGWLQQSFA